MCNHVRQDFALGSRQEGEQQAVTPGGPRQVRWGVGALPLPQAREHDPPCPQGDQGPELLFHVATGSSSVFRLIKRTFLDHVVGAGERDPWDRRPERARGSQVKDQELKAPSFVQKFRYAGFPPWQWPHLFWPLICFRGGLTHRQAPAHSAQTSLDMRLLTGPSTINR